MSGNADITMTVGILPLSISKVIADLDCGYAVLGDHEWYFKKTLVSNTSTALIHGNLMTDENIGVVHHAIVPGTDIVKFLFFRNQSANIVYLQLDGSTASASDRDAIIIPAGKAWFGHLQCEVEEITAVTNTSTSVCDVAAVIENV